MDVVSGLIYYDDASNINEQDYDGDTPLNIACHEGHDDIVSLLMSIFPNTLIENDQRLTPFQTSRANGFLHYLPMLQHFVTAGDEFESPASK